MKKGTAQIVHHQVGDFSCNWDHEAKSRQDRVLNTWAEVKGMTNGGFELVQRHQFAIVTRSTGAGGNWIDHILHFSRHQNVECVGVFTALGATWANVTDHHPLRSKFVLSSVYNAINKHSNTGIY